MVQHAKEYAIIDPLEEGMFAETPHLLQAVNIPLSYLEARIRTLVPRLDTAVVIPHNMMGFGERAHAELFMLGYKNVHLVCASADDWEAVGLPLYTGFNVKSKAFGEAVEFTDSTPTLDPEEYQKIKSRYPDVNIIDVRPFPEYSYETIPGAINIPGMDLLLARDYLTTHGQPLVIHCGGRTRGIIAVQTLRALGINDAHSLKNGTMGWELSGLDLEYSTKRPPVSLQSSVAVMDCAVASERLGVNFSDPSEVAVDHFAGKTVYLFDVRSASEFEDNKADVMRHAPGGQLIQAFDSYAATHNSIVYLFDDLGVRALATAYWLRRMGIDAKAIDRLPGNRYPDPESSPSHRNDQDSCPETMTFEAFLKLEGQAFVIDFSPSLKFVLGHIPGSLHGVRSLIVEWLLENPKEEIVITSDQSDILMSASNDLQKAGISHRVLHQGAIKWAESGRNLSSDSGDLLFGHIDVFRRPIERLDEKEAAMQAYLDWEVNLLEKLKIDVSVTFPIH